MYRLTGNKKYDYMKLGVTYPKTNQTSTLRNQATGTLSSVANISTVKPAGVDGKDYITVTLAVFQTSTDLEDSNADFHIAIREPDGTTSQRNGQSFDGGDNSIETKIPQSSDPFVKIRQEYGGNGRFSEQTLFLTPRQ